MRELLEVETALHSPTAARRQRERLQKQQERLRTEDVEVDDDDDDEERFLAHLQRALLERVEMLDQSFLVLRARQVSCAAARLHEALEPKRDVDTRLIQAWTIQPQSHRKVKAGGHLEVLKLSTIFREVQRLRLHQLATASRAPVALEIFPSLRALEVLHTPVAALRHVHYFARQLRFLHIEQTDMVALEQVLTPSTSNDGSTHGTDVVWRTLETLQINCCELLTVDMSVNQLRVVRHLDLGWNRIQAFDEPLVAASSSLEVLLLCHNKLRTVPPIQSLQRLRELDLSVNQITSLRGLETLRALEALDVSHNSVDRMTDVELLVGLTKLRRLVLQHNPIARRPDYRREVLFYVGDSVELDREPWSAAELLSMKNSRQCSAESRSADNAEWSVAQLVTRPLSAKNARASGGGKLTLTYPVLPPRVDAMAPQVVEIRRAVSMLSPRSRHHQQLQPFSELPSRTMSLSRLTSTDDTGQASYPLDDDDDDDDEADSGGGELFRTVDDYFTTQGDFIVVLDQALVDARVEQANGTRSQGGYGLVSTVVVDN